MKSTNKTVIVGWYENARVYKSMQKVPKDVLDKRENKSKCEFNIYAEKAIIVPQEKRDFIIKVEDTMYGIIQIMKNYPMGNI